jgi:hypothetical protein
VSATAHDERARAASGYFLFAYLGFSVPVILSGFVSDHLGILPALSIFGVIAIIWNAGIAYAMGLVHLRT